MRRVLTSSKSILEDMSDKQFVEKTHAQIYSSYRRDTPEEVVEKIISFLKQKLDGPLSTAVDVGCGSGQSTVCFVHYFEQVYGLDVSEAQVKQARDSRPSPNLEYRVCPAEELPFDDHSVQLITAATALHWFDLDRFFAEARRVLCDNGVLAVFGYTSMKLMVEDAEQDEQMDHLYEEYLKTLDPYMLPNARILVSDKYKSINFPFEKVIRHETIRCPFVGRPSDIVNFVSTISGQQNYRKADPSGAEACLNAFRDRLYEIGVAANIKPDDVTTLYQDYILVLSRKQEL